MTFSSTNFYVHLAKVLPSPAPLKLLVGYSLFSCRSFLILQVFVERPTALLAGEYKDFNYFQIYFLRLCLGTLTSIVSLLLIHLHFKDGWIA